MRAPPPRAGRHDAAHQRAGAPEPEQRSRRRRRCRAHPPPRRRRPRPPRTQRPGPAGRARACAWRARAASRRAGATATARDARRARRASAAKDRGAGHGGRRPATASAALVDQAAADGRARAAARRSRVSSIDGGLGSVGGAQTRRGRRRTAGSSVRMHAPTGGDGEPDHAGQRDERGQRRSRPGARPLAPSAAPATLAPATEDRTSARDGRRAGRGAGRRRPSRDRIGARHDAGSGERAGEVLGVDEQADAEHRHRQTREDRDDREAQRAGRRDEGKPWLARLGRHWFTHECQLAYRDEGQFRGIELMVGLDRDLRGPHCARSSSTSCARPFARARCVAEGARPAVDPRARARARRRPRGGHGGLRPARGRGLPRLQPGGADARRRPRREAGRPHEVALPEPARAALRLPSRGARRVALPAHGVGRPRCAGPCARAPDARLPATATRPARRSCAGALAHLPRPCARRRCRSRDG